MSDKNESIYLKTAFYWMKRWRNALEQKQFDEAQNYFKRANRWKRRANIDGMLQQICEPLEQN